MPGVWRMTAAFGWLHGKAGIACAECDSRMDGLEKKWDMKLREFAQPYTGKCSPCRNDEARRKANCAQGLSAPTSPSGLSSRAMALTFLGQVLGAGPR